LWVCRINCHHQYRFPFQYGNFLQHYVGQVLQYWNFLSTLSLCIQIIHTRTWRAPCRAGLISGALIFWGV
jgi:hypothetical protein